MTEELILKRPDPAYADQIAEYRREFLEAGDSMDGCGALRRLEDPFEWVALTEEFSDPERVPPQLVQATQFLCIRRSDNRLVGMIQVRHTLNDFLEKFGGHIGYSVRPTERRRGYAKKMLEAYLPYCRKLGIQKVLITCLEDNEGSRRTILANGGVYESTVYEPQEKVNLQRYWITLTGIA